jgi:hypothetical protein
MKKEGFEDNKRLTRINMEGQRGWDVRIERQTKVDG